jgi:hypothetical protein
MHAGRPSSPGSSASCCSGSADKMTSAALRIWSPSGRSRVRRLDFPADEAFSDYPRLGTAGKKKILGLNAPGSTTSTCPPNANGRLPGPGAQDDAQLVAGHDRSGPRPRGGRCPQRPPPGCCSAGSGSRADGRSPRSASWPVHGHGDGDASVRRGCRRTSRAQFRLPDGRRCLRRAAALPGVRQAEVSGSFRLGRDRRRVAAGFTAPGRSTARRSASWTSCARLPARRCGFGHQVCRPLRKAATSPSAAR